MTVSDQCIALKASLQIELPPGVAQTAAMAAVDLCAANINLVAKQTDKAAADALAKLDTATLPPAVAAAWVQVVRAQASAAADAAAQQAKVGP